MRRQSAMVGVEISPEAVHLLQLTRADTGVQVSHYACEPLPSGALLDGQVDDIETVGVAIARARERSGTRARFAAVALAAPVAVLRLVSVPADLKEADLEAQLELEAMRHLPVANARLSLDFECVGPMPDDPDQVQVLLAIAHSTPVNQAVAALKRGGLRVAVVDVDALALARALTVFTGQSLPPEQAITLNRQTVQPPEAATAFWAHIIPSEDIKHNAPALLIACGLALRGVRL